MENDTNTPSPTQPAPPAPLDHSKTPNPQTPPQAPLQTPGAATSSQLLPKHHNFPMHKVLIIALITLAIIFITAYVGVYYLLNQQLDKITKSRSAPTPTASVSSPSPSPLTDEVHFPGGEQTPKTTQVACTLEAKLCSDGSYVSRSGPNCEFAACPE